VTAAVTTYRRPALAKRAIASLVAQTYRPLEMIVVEDGEDSGLAKWLKRYADIQYLRLPENRGVAAARNAALAVAQGEYIAYLDDDDIWKPERIARGVDRLGALSEEARRQVAVVEVGLEAHFPGREMIAIGHPANRGPLRLSILRSGIVSLSSAHLFLVAALRGVGGFDETLLSSLDDDVWMTLAAAGWSAEVMDEGLVMTMENPGRPRLTGNPEERIENVRAFLCKWHPTFAEWLGSAQGTRYEQHYFCRVIANLAANRLVAGDMKGFRVAAVAVLREAKPLSHGLRELVRAMTTFGAYRYLPDPLLQLARRIGK
jgi:glycosyltransferase involved in cell wall biosynthesis